MYVGLFLEFRDALPVEFVAATDGVDNDVVADDGPLAKSNIIRSRIIAKLMNLLNAAPIINNNHRRRSKKVA
ncbi:hypothetical protein ACLKA6_019709 [Drosophila palustris]